MLAKLGKKLFSHGDNQARDGEKPARSSQFTQAFKDIASFYKICDLFPYDAYDPKTKIFYNQESIGFVIETAPLVGASSEMQKEVANLFALALPEESSLQVLLWADPHIGDQLDVYQAARSEQSETLQQMAKRRVEYLKTFAYDSPFKPYCLRNFRCFLSFSKKRDSSIRADQELCERLKNQIVTTLEMLGLPVKIWDASNLLSTTESILSSNPAWVHAPVIEWNPLQSLAPQLNSGNKNLQVTEDGLYLNNRALKVRTYGVRSYPQHWSLHAMGELIGDLDRDQAQIPCPFMIHYGVTIPKQDKPKNKLMAKASYVEKQAYSPIGKYLPSIMAEAAELAFVREAINKGERIVQAQFGVILMAKPEEMDNAEQILLNLFTAKEWKLEANRYLHLPMFLTSLPMMWGEEQVQALLKLEKLKTTLSTESANLLPIQGEWKGTSTPGMLLAGRRGQVFTWSPFDNKAGNYNVCVVGRSGSGKSVFMQELVTTTLSIGGVVFVFDVGRSFEKICLLLDGQFVEFSSSSNICLNPFTNIPTDNEEVASDILAMLKSVLVLMAAPIHGLDDPGASLLEQAMLETWGSFKNESTISNIVDWLTNKSEITGSQRAENLAQMLYPYTKNGTYGRFFNGPSTVNLDNPFIVIELEELKERKDLQAVVLQMIIINVTNKMFLGDRKTPFNIVFDEAWDMLRGKQSGVFIETLARRLRKYKGSLIVGTQSINDFYQSPGAQAAFDNSDLMCMLSQKPESIDQLKKTDRISMSAQKEEQMKSIKTKQGQFAELMIISPEGYAVCRFMLDDFSNLLFSTRAEDFSAVNQLTKAQIGINITMNDAIDQLISSSKLLTIN
jgi:conjugal transfer ATP-binding protein TraC